MTEKHKVRFEPVGIEIDVDENQTILRAAAEQGIMLMHGCKEGQCASCKSFILEGEDIEHDQYSTFALPDYEKEEGYTLLCRAHAYEDVTIELLNYDEDMIRSGLPIQQADAEVVSKDPVTHDMRHLVLRLIEPGEVKFFPGQYMDISVPGTDQVRSFSMANTSSRERAARVRHQGVPGRAVLPVPRRRTPGRRPPGADRPVRRLHLARVRRGAGLRGRRSGDGPDPVPAPLHGRARHPPPGHVLLRRPRASATSASRTSCARSRRSCRTSPTSRLLSAIEDWDGENGLITDVVKRLTGEPRRRARLRLRAAAHGGGRDPAARDARRPGKAGLLRQVHDNRRAQS